MANAPKAMKPPSARGSSSEYGRCHSRASASTTVGKTSITRWSSRCPALMNGTSQRRALTGEAYPVKSPAMSAVSGVVLAGGQGRRMGGVDKGLQPLRGKPMAQWALERLAPQVDEVLINCNQNLDAYARFGYRVVPDEIGGFAGPLAGLHACLNAASHPLVVTVPCDSPF